MYFYALPASTPEKVSSQTSVEVSTQTEWDRLIIIGILLLRPQVSKVYPASLFVD
ncbi:hypothetical protein LCGC14_1984560, partial [marine sediment metagenome]